MAIIFVVHEALAGHCLIKLQLNMQLWTLIIMAACMMD